ncbi:MAG: acetyltransferase-like isoleucine patch superfamily enzyme [Mariniflexile sp.]|jgi:acetyltransferase-like isoleucine patch superfamily enzyme
MFRFLRLIFSSRIFNLIFNYFTFRFNKVVFSGFVKVNGLIKIKNEGKIIINNNVIINSGKNNNVIGGDTRTNLIVEKEGLLSIGSNVGISNSTFYCTKEILIEDNVLIGGGCRLYDTDFHSIDYKNRMNPFLNGLADEQTVSKSIVIKNGAWIGGSSIILKGVIIGSKSIVGAGSVVAKNVPPGEIWAGNPAKFIKKAF